MTAPAADRIALEFTVALATGPDRAFAALTEPAALTGWFCDEAEVEPGPGGRIVLRWRRPGSSPQPFVGRWTEWDPPRVAAYEGGHSGYPGGRAGVVRWTLAGAAGAGTIATVTHLLPRTDDYTPIAERYREAWPRALDRLARRFEPEGSTA